jgi:WD40 repeat protein
MASCDVVKLLDLETNWRTGNCTTRKFDCGLVDNATPFALSDKYLAAPQEDFTIKSWNRKTLDCENIFRGHEDQIDCLQCYNDYLITGSRDKTIKVWDLETAELVSVFVTFNLQSKYLC